MNYLLYTINCTLSSLNTLLFIQNILLCTLDSVHHETNYVVLLAKAKASICFNNKIKNYCFKYFKYIYILNNLLMFKYIIELNLLILYTLL